MVRFVNSPNKSASIHRTKVRQFTEQKCVNPPNEWQDAPKFCDAIRYDVDHSDGYGTSGLVEIKLGGEALIEEGAKTLNMLSGLIDTSRQKEVAFKMIVTATGDFAYQRTDGVFVCPLSALRP